MIVGAGMDIVQISRIEQVYNKYQEKFARRILSESEYHRFNQSKSKISYLAKRFAAKEAAVKAMGTGFRKGITPRMVEINNIETGQPVLEMVGAAKAFADKMGVSATWVSISDEKHYAAAMVIMEKN